MIFLGSIVNAAAIIVGGITGSLAKNGLPERFSKLLLSVLGLFTFALGIMFTMKMQDTKDVLIVVISLVIGAVIGELIDIEKRLDSLGNYVQSKLKNFKGNFSQGFVTSSLLFCVGSMAIMGALQSGLANDHATLFTKAIMDGIISIVFASTMGIGVSASAVPVFIYQGTITLLAASIAPYLSETVIREMTAAGGILLMGIAFNILDVKRIKVGNLLPAIFLPLIIMLIIH